MVGSSVVFASIGAIFVHKSCEASQQKGQRPEDIHAAFGALSSNCHWLGMDGK